MSSRQGEMKEGRDSEKELRRVRSGEKKRGGKMEKETDKNATS